MHPLDEAPLGKKIIYIANYKPDLLFPIPRKLQRDQIGIGKELPFQGDDIWNAYEISWLNSKGKPEIACGEFYFPCTSPKLIESKSFKLYLNSFNNTVFNSFADVQNTIMRDLSKACEAIVTVRLIPLNQMPLNLRANFTGICLDTLDVSCDTYSVNPKLLQTENSFASESLYTDLFKSNCLITGQPDWASMQIIYTGRKIQHASLLKYLISYRNHDEFHEQCVERIFTDLQKYCELQKLFVCARYTRRGGLDNNPYRCNYPIRMANLRILRQ